jgi:hypothetical protein
LADDQILARVQDHPVVVNGPRADHRYDAPDIVQVLWISYEANHEHVLTSDVIAVDETWWRLMKKGATKRWWVRCRARQRGKAIAYTSGLWPGLVRFLGDPKIPLDTNRVERALRGVVVGSENHYGSRSERGTRVAALFYSLIDSAKLCGVEPRAYLLEVTLRAVRNPAAATLARDLK